MNQRLIEIIRYKTGGVQSEFAALMGWTPQYLAKLLRGDNFGLTPVLAIVRAFPEVDARWLLTGEGQMLGVSPLMQLYLDDMELQAFMNDEELRSCGTDIDGVGAGIFTPKFRAILKRRLTDRLSGRGCEFGPLES